MDVYVPCVCLVPLAILSRRRRFPGTGVTDVVSHQAGVGVGPVFLIRAVGALNHPQSDILVHGKFNPSCHLLMPVIIS